VTVIGAMLQGKKVVKAEDEDSEDQLEVHSEV
jgi:hypothetical protein